MSVGNWVRRWKRSQAPKTIRRPRLGMEHLEDRTTPAITAVANAGVLTVSLSASNDNATVGGLSATGTDIGVIGNSFPQQSFSGITGIVVNDTSGGSATGQRVGFADVGGTARMTLTGSVTVTNIETIALNNPANVMTVNGNFTITGASVVNAINSLPQLSVGGTISITASGTGDAIGTAANPIRLVGNAAFLTTNTTAGNGNQYFDLGGAGNALNVNGGSGGQINAGTGTVTLTNGQFFAGGVNDYGDNTTFNIGTGGCLSVFNSETIGGLTGTGVVGTAGPGTHSILVGGGNAGSTFAGTIQNVAPVTNGAGVLALQKTGTGTLTLNGANTFTGGTTVNGGILKVIGVNGQNRLANNSLVTVNSAGIFEIADTNPIPTVANAIDVTLNGGILQLSGASNSGDHIRNLTFNNGGTVRNSGSLSSFGNTNLAVNGTITVSGSSSTPASIDLPNGIAIANTTFSVADITGNANPDLVFSATTGIREVGSTATLTKTGAGTLVLGADSSYTGTTTISAGTLQVGAGGTTGSLGSGAVTNNGTLTYNRSVNTVLANAVSGNGNLVKQGGGSLSVTANNSYSGTTTISAGQLDVGLNGTTGTLGSGAVVNNAVLTFFRSDAHTIANAISGTGGIAQFGTGVVTLTGANTYSGNTQINPGTTLRVGNGGTAGSIGTGVIFNGGTIVFNRSDTLTVSAPITGATLVRQEGTGTTILTGANTYTGTTTIAAGTLQIGNGTAANSLGSGAVTNNGTLVFNRTGDYTVANAINGNGSLNFLQNGVKTLTGAVSLNGAITSSGGGTLLANATIANGAAATDATTSGASVIGGFGTIQGATVVTSGGALLPGDANTVGTLNTGNVTLNSGSFFGVKLTGFVVGDSLNVTGTVNLGGATLFAIDTLAALGQFVIINNDGTDPVTGTFAGLPEGATFIGNNGKPFLITYRGGDGNDVVLTPETLPTRLLATGPGNGGGVLLNVTAGSTYGAPTNVSLIPGFGGEIRVARVDVNGDGTRDLVAGSGPGGSRIRILNGNDNTTVIADFNAFPGFGGGVYVAGGDFNNDGFEELVVTGDGADAFSGPVANGLGVRIYSGATLTGSNPPVLASFNGLASLSGAQGEGAAVRLGGRPAVADVNGDARPDLLIAAGNGGGPRVVIWPGQAFLTTSNGQPPVNPIANLFVFESTQRGGAFLTAGDLNGDSFADIAVGGGPGGGPRVRTVNSFLMLGLPNLEAVNLDDPVNLANGLVLNNFFSGDGNSRGGVRVAMRDADLDGLADLVTASGTNEPSQIRIYTDTSVAAVFGTSSEPSGPQVIDPFSALLPGGVWIG